MPFIFSSEQDSDNDSEFSLPSPPLVMNRRMKLVHIYLLNVCQRKNAFLFPNKHDQKLNDQLTAQTKENRWLIQNPYPMHNIF